MADMPITRTTPTGPFRPQGGSAPLTAPGETPPAGTPAEQPNARPGGTAPLAADSSALSGRPGTSRLTLPAVAAVGDLAAEGARALTAIADPDAVQGVTDSVQGVVDIVSGAADTSSGLSESVRNAANTTVRIANKVNDTIGEGTRLGNGMMIGGGALGVVGGGAQALGGVNKLTDGDASNNVEGGMEVAQGALRMGEGGGMVFATAAANSTRFAGAATTVGGRVVPVLGAAAGAVQTVNALMKDPPDMTSAATGAMTAVGSAAMLFPPVGTAVGGAMVATAAIIDNWVSISSAAGTAAEAVGDAASAVGNAASNAASAVSNAASNAASKVASWFGW